MTAATKTRNQIKYVKWKIANNEKANAMCSGDLTESKSSVAHRHSYLFHKLIDACAKSKQKIAALFLASD